MAADQPVPGTRTGFAVGGIEEFADASTRASSAIDEGGYIPPKSPFNLGRWFRATGWRHIVGIVMVAFSLFPIVFVVSSSLNPQGKLTG